MNIKINIWKRVSYKSGDLFLTRRRREPTPSGGKQFGYLFPEASFRTIAHEIGHGAFSLEHPFNRPLRNSFEKGALKDNLMDYTEGVGFAKIQWDQTRAPGLVIGMFQTDKDAQLAIFGGITWLGNILWGLAPDSQEKEIENIKDLLDYVHNNYRDYFEKSKAANTNIAKVEYNEWSVRQDSHKGNICQSIYKKFTEKEDNHFTLWYKGIFIENYKLKDKEYQVAVYSTQEKVDLLNDKVRLQGYRDLRNNTYVKAGYTRNYGIIVFYGEDKKFKTLLQISGEDKPEKIAQQWLNYLSIVVASDEQKEQDKDIIDKIIALIGKLFSKEELPEVWGEETTITPSSIETIIETENFVTQSPGQCYQACVDIMKNHDNNYTPSHNLWALATWDGDGDESIHAECYIKGIQALNAELDAGHPVIVGVDYHSGKGNFDDLTDHWVVIVGRGNDEKGQYYTYFEVAKTKEEGGTDMERNRFYFHEKGYLQSINKTANRDKSLFVVTAIRINPTDCCCSRYTLDDTNTSCKNSCETYNHKETPKGILIKFRK